MAEPIPMPPDGDVSRAPMLLGVCWTLTVISTLCVAGRLFTRLKIVHNFGYDDAVCIVSILLQIVSVCILAAGTVAGVGRHVYYLTPDQRMQAIRLNVIAQPFGILAFCVPKLAVAILLIRIMPPAKRRAWFLLALTISLIILGALCAILLFVQCSPPKTLWEPTTPGAHCWDSSILVNYTIFVGSFSAFLDITLAVFPITIFWSLQMNLPKKIGICCLMGLGVFAAVCAIIKTTKLNELGQLSDYTWATTSLLLWSNVESNVVIICACLPTLQPLVAVMLGKDRHGYSHGSSKRSRGAKSRRTFQNLDNDVVALKPVASPITGGLDRSDLPSEAFYPARTGLPPSDGGV